MERPGVPQRPGVGGVDVRALDRLELRAQIGYVEQDAPVLAGSLRDNLTLWTSNNDDDAPDQ